jgi:hypothetical protein
MATLVINTSSGDHASWFWGSWQLVTPFAARCKFDKNPKRNDPHHRSPGLMTVIPALDSLERLIFDRYVKAAKQAARKKQS